VRSTAALTSSDRFGFSRCVSLGVIVTIFTVKLRELCSTGAVKRILNENRSAANMAPLPDSVRFRAGSRFDSQVPGVSEIRSPIAVFEAVKVSKDGQRVPLHVEIGTPRLVEGNDGLWSCQILLRGVDAQVRQVYGDDSLQALCFAIRAIESQLRVIEEVGHRIVDEEGNDVPLDAYWG
jgi:uncharacterized protein DUF6968